MKTDQNSNLGGSRLIRLKEALSALAISKSQLYRLIDQGEIPRPLKQGRRSYFTLEDLEAYKAKLERGLL